MDGLSRAIGAGAPVTLAGKTYLSSPLSLEDIGVIEHTMLLERGSPVDDVLRECRGRPERLIVDMLDRAKREMKRNRFLRIVKVEEFEEYLSSDEGVDLTLWLCLRKNHRGVEFLEDAKAIRKKASIEEVVNFGKVRNRISGIDVMCMLDWPDESESIRPEVAARRKMQEASSYRVAPWRKNFRRLKEAGVAEADLRSLTFYQFRILTEDEEALGGVSRVDLSDLNTQTLKKEKPIIVIGKDGKGLEELKRLKEGSKNGDQGS